MRRNERSRDGRRKDALPSPSLGEIYGAERNNSAAAYMEQYGMVWYGREASHGLTIPHSSPAKSAMYALLHPIVLPATPTPDIHSTSTTETTATWAINSLLYPIISFIASLLIYLHTVSD